MYGVQCPSGNGNSRLPITAQAGSGWELYHHAGWGRVINCLRNSSNGHTDIGYTGGNTCIIYVDGSQGDAHLNVVVQVAERHRIHTTECAAPFTDERDLIGTVSSPIEFSRPCLNGSCDGGLIQSSDAPPSNALRVNHRAAHTRRASSSRASAAYCKLCDQVQRTLPPLGAPFPASRVSPDACQRHHQ